MTTRLGARDLLVDLEPAPAGPFGETVRRLSIPHWMAGGVGKDDVPVLLEQDAGGFRLRLGERIYAYNRWGLAAAGQNA